MRESYRPNRHFCGPKVTNLRPIVAFRCWAMSPLRERSRAPTRLPRSSRRRPRRIAASVRAIGRHDPAVTNGLDVVVRALPRVIHESTERPRSGAEYGPLQNLSRSNLPTNSEADRESHSPGAARTLLAPPLSVDTGGSASNGEPERHSVDPLPLRTDQSESQHDEIDQRHSHSLLTLCSRTPGRLHGPSRVRLLTWRPPPRTPASRE